MDENNENSRNIVIEIDLENPSPTLQPASINTYQTHSSSTNNLFNYEDLLTDVPLQTTTDPADRMHESHKPPFIICDSCVFYKQTINMYKQQLYTMEQEIINRREKLTNSYNEFRKVLNLKKELIEKYSMKNESSRSLTSESFSRSTNNIYSYKYSDAGSSYSNIKKQTEWHDEYMNNFNNDCEKNMHTDSRKNKPSGNNKHQEEKNLFYVDFENLDDENLF